ncbi:hypothetical protein Vretimale_10166 [Volvox reticuliferus]|uniref:Glycosyltransferase 2-like domain-containing protein n=1 Tax=Volvox reticuliferus TaxID=1737510 RepID=A0A8J4BWZ7_9CHLO|nr:hypothetical protein Vretifemale_597 [Volvox reticuliferus]GIM05728.1 hypothetical protein Vretimale_10166 [Volvox reticuliferus]
MRKSAWYDNIAVLTLTLLAPYVAAGPDPNPLAGCSSFAHKLLGKERTDLRAEAQAVQALLSQIQLARLGPTSNTTAMIKLTNWLLSNQSKAGANLDTASLCLTNRLSPSAYHGRPTFSILLEYFKRPWGIHRMATSLRDACARADSDCELVVNVDNPHEAGAWAEVAEQYKGFVVPVFSANVHEARGYNRAARLARGKYLIIWQDDQLAPSQSSTWLTELLALFQAWPRLAIVGMNTYRLCKDREPTNRFFTTPWNPDPRTGVKWSFVQLVDFAPLVIRASAFSELGGLEEGFTRPGDCGIWGDWELCSRAWLAGWQVGYLYLEGRGGDGHEGGTHTSSNAERCWGRQQLVAASGFVKRFGRDPYQLEVCEKVRQLNVASFDLASPEDCPYGTEATKFGNCTRY